MKPGLAFLLLFAGTGFAANPASDKEMEDPLTITLTAGSYTVKDLPDGHEVVLENFGSLIIPGAPLLPSKIFSIAIPPGMALSRITFEAGDRIRIPGRFSIPPTAPRHLMGEEDPEIQRMMQAEYEANLKKSYGNDDPFPSVPCEFIRTAEYRQYRLVDLRFIPFVYFPESGRLFHVPHVKVSLYLEQAEPRTGPRDHGLTGTEKSACEIIYNYDQARSWYGPPRQRTGGDQYDYVIVTLDDLVTALETLVEWESIKGRSVKVVTLDWIEENYDGYDLAERIRNFLRDKYPSEAWGIEDVLLVGHSSDLPMRKTIGNWGSGVPWTDYYYAELSLPDNRSWDSNGDHVWGGYEDNIDFYNEVNVGRFPWSDPEVVEHICKKTVSFEKNNDPEFKKNILLMGSFIGPWYDEAELMEYLSNANNNPWMREWKTTKLYEKNDWNWSIFPCDFELLHSNVMEQWSKGKYAVANWCGHGSPFSCHILWGGMPYFISTYDCPFLNDDYPSVIFAFSCENSMQKYDNIGHMMMKQGAVGFLGATQVALAAPEWKHPRHGGANTLDYLFISHVTAGELSMGQAHQQALRQMYIHGYFLENTFEISTWGALFGNPGLRLSGIEAVGLSFPDGLPEKKNNPGTETVIPVRIESGYEVFVPGTGQIHYRFDPEDPYTIESVTSLGNGLYEARLPHTAPGDRPEFYFSAQGDGGTTVYSPHDAPDTVYAFDVCFCETLVDDDFETDQGWTVESSDLASGEWIRVDPNGTLAQPEDDFSTDGDLCFVTGQGTEGAYMGEADVDGGPTRLISPVIDLSEGDAVISFYLWYYHGDSGAKQPLEIELSNDGGMSWLQVETVQHDPKWSFKSFRVSDHIDPTAEVRMRLTVTDNPNDDTVEAAIDDFMVNRYEYDPTLWSDTYLLSACQGGVVNYTLNAGSAHAFRSYLLLGTLSGTEPGFVIPGGKVMPLNWDFFTQTLLKLLNTAAAPGFADTLDGNGEAAASLDTLGRVDPHLAGSTASFAFVLLPPPSWDFVSNPIDLIIDP